MAPDLDARARDDARSARAVQRQLARLRELSPAGKALADGVVDDAETKALRPIIAQLHERCAKWLRDHGGAE